MKVIEKQPIKEKLKVAPYELPEGWRWVKLGDIGNVTKLAGFEFTKYVKYCDDGEIIAIRGLNLKNGRLDLTKVKRIKKKVSDFLVRSRIYKNDILFSYAGSIGLIALADKDNTYHLAPNVAKISLTNKRVFPFFVLTYLLSPNVKQEIEKYKKQMGQPSISMQNIRKILVPLPFKQNRPDLEAQKQIVEKIDTIFKKIEHGEKLRQTALQKTKTAFDAVLNKIFKEAEEGKGWKWAELGKISTVFSGSSAPQNKKYFEDGVFPFVRVSDLGKYGKTDNLTDIRDYINDLAVKEQRLVKANKGTIIFPKSGAAILTNNKGILGVDAYVVSHLACIEADNSAVISKYLFYILYNFDMKAIVNNLSYPSLTLTEIKKIRIPIPFKNNHPDLEKQRQIVDYLDRLQGKIKQLEGLQTIQLQKFMALKESILNKAFRGEL